MELLVTFFGTMFAGAITLLSIAVVCWIFNGCKHSSLWKWLDNLNLIPCTKDGIAIHGLGALILLSFGIGIFAEGMTDYMTDSEAPPLLAFAIGSEGEHRFDALFRKEEGMWKYTGLGREVFMTEHGSNYVTAILKDRPYSTTFVKKPIKVITIYDRLGRIEEAHRLVNRLYYPAKNWAAGQEFYSKELDSLQMRIDWSRSTFLIVVVVPATTSLGMVIRNKVKGSPLSIKPRRLVILGSVMLLVALASRQGYSQFENQFNERAFGYFLSHLQRELWISQTGKDNGRLVPHSSPRIWHNNSTGTPSDKS